MHSFKCEVYYEIVSSIIFPFCLNTLTSTMFSNISNLCSSLQMTCDVPHLYKRTSEITLWFILIVTLSGRNFCRFKVITWLDGATRLRNFQLPSKINTKLLYFYCSCISRLVFCIVTLYTLVDRYLSTEIHIITTLKAIRLILDVVKT